MDSVGKVARLVGLAMHGGQDPDGVFSGKGDMVKSQVDSFNLTVLI